MQNLVMGQVASGMVIGRDEDVQPTTVTIDLARINHVLGTELSLDTVSDIFKTIGLSNGRC
ncbi:hypothetical protein [Lactiplantibacillus plantarum]|uniref:hypothetical protein n=1 Tax=Lactiplantibacillus plantarum TaxID=1590 RepID=UPI0004898FE9|nr:hypothetical protein [Lactiplantibacillus plantarum]